MKLKIAALTLVTSAMSWSAVSAAHATARHRSHSSVHNKPIHLTVAKHSRGTHAQRGHGVGGYTHRVAYHRGYTTHTRSRHVIQCVAFAKNESNVQLRGNARDWWYNAAGVYARGTTPEVGSVMNFRSIRRMPLGHVAVVTGIEDSRTVIIDQAHWAQNGISRNVRVIDVSPGNDWSQVRVALNGNPDRFGSIYPIYGFIYPRGEHESSVMTASASQASPVSTQMAEAPDTAGTIEEDYSSAAPAATATRRHKMFRKKHTNVRHKTVVRHK